MKADLTHAHPDLLAAIDRVLAAMEAFGTPMLVFECERTLERQRALYAQGRTKAGPIVTDCDGLKRSSKHQPQADGRVYAADLVFVVEGKPNWSLTLPWGVYGAMVRACGLSWGGSRSRVPDCPHMQVPLGA